MSDLRFESIRLVSFLERKSRLIEFHPEMTALVGANGRGKSAILKSLYATLGANPWKVTRGWREAGVHSCLTFTLGGRRFRMLHDGSTHTLFGEGDEVVGMFATHGALAEFYVQFLRFPMRLQTREGPGRQAYPAMLFLPYYFDQDKSWGDPWLSFQGLTAFRDHRRHAAQFHAGIRPKEYYDALASRDAAQSRVGEHVYQRKVLKRTLTEVRRRMGVADFDLDLDRFKEELAELLELCEELRAREQEYKAKLLKLYDKRSVLETQLAVGGNALAELQADTTFADRLSEAEVMCPTCGSTHLNDFGARFQIAADEGRCRALVADVQTQLLKLRVKIERLEQETSAAGHELSQVQQLLERKQADVKLHDLLRSEGRAELRDVLASEVSELDKQAGEATAQVESAVETIRALTDKERARKTRAEWQGLFHRNLSELGVDEVVPDSTRQMWSPIQASGSRTPRALLAFYFSFLELARRHSTSTFCPIVIDSPKQQDPDSANWQRMLAFIRDRRPSGAQIVLSATDLAGVDMGGSVIELLEHRQVLSTDEYADGAAEVSALLDIASRFAEEQGA